MDLFLHYICIFMALFYYMFLHIAPAFCFCQLLFCCLREKIIKYRVWDDIVITPCTYCVWYYCAILTAASSQFCPFHQEYTIKIKRIDSDCINLFSCHYIVLYFVECPLSASRIPCMSSHMLYNVYVGVAGSTVSAFMLDGDLYLDFSVDLALLSMIFSVIVPHYFICFPLSCLILQSELSGHPFFSKMPKLVHL